MNKTLLFVFTTLAFVSMSQVKLSKDFTLDASKPYPVVDAKHKKYLSVGDNKTISVKTDGEIVTIQGFDSETMKETSRKTYEDFPKYSKVQRIIQTNGAIQYIFEAYNKSDKTFSVYSREIDIASGTFKEAKTLFTTSKPVTNAGRDEDGRTPIGESDARMIKLDGTKFDVFQSFDKSKILIQYRVKPSEKSDAINKDEIGFYVFDSNMSKLWGGEVKMPYTEKEMNNLAYTVSSNGTAYMLIYLNEKKKFELLTIKNQKEVTQNALAIDGKLVFQRFNLLEDKNGHITCAGYYANGLDVKVNWTGSASLSFNTNGIYCFKMTTDGEVSDVWNYEFPLELIQQYNTEKEQEKIKTREEAGKAGIPDLKMLEFIAQADGSYIVIGEQQYIRNEMVMTSTANVNHFGHIVITKIGADGKVAWSKKLPKNQAFVTGDSYLPYGEGQLSIRYAENNGEHYILFVDNPKNADLALNKVPEGHKSGAGGFLSAFKVSDVDGSVERHTVADLESLDGVKAYQFQVTRINNVADKTFLLEVYKKDKEDAMIKITLND
jgi:hypothetical protein